MNGAELLIQTAAANDIEACFANPGTTEIPLVHALEQTPAMRSVLFLFEGGATGAADGYARMAGKPAMTLLHLGPGFANGMANLHNARRARVPVVNIIGDHASWHRPADPPLNMDIAAAAGAVSDWVGAVTAPTDIAQQMTAAVAAARRGRCASLTVPHDFQLADLTDATPLVVAPERLPVNHDAVETAAHRLRQGGAIALILGGRALLEPGLAALHAIQAATGCDLFAESFAPRIERGAGRPVVPRVPYFPQQALPALERYTCILLVGARRPTAFFGWPGAPSYFTRDDQETITLAGEDEDELAALQTLAAALDVRTAPVRASHAPQPKGIPHGSLTAATAGAVIAALQPENAVVVNEAISSSQRYLELSQDAPPHSLLNLTGGAIGIGIPLATGAAIACPDRPVLNVQADGSAMYTLQALWTQSREALNVTTLIFSNRRYQILATELGRAGLVTPDAPLSHMVSLDNPALRWTELARGMGVPAVAVDNAADLHLALRRALAEAGPHLIEMQMAD